MEKPDRDETESVVGYEFEFTYQLETPPLDSRMDVTQLPFNRLIGLEASLHGSEFLISLPAGPQYGNHLGTVHASALLAVAEAGSGAFLARHMGPVEGVVPVVRRIEAKFRKPAKGRVFARCLVPLEAVAAWSADLAARGRVSASLPVEVVDEAGSVVVSTVIEWFVARAPVHDSPTFRHPD